ncbi:NAD(P)H-dependent oxidoreductase [Candidatus Peregrinibacteria bacterium]|jgi:FAD reductase [NAD(P)H]|nr:NAD(P)H-dependent oxidoreductase [Candidatus Peregrinibacteria bacterium]
MKKVILISGSLRKSSLSSVLIQEARRVLQEKGLDTEIIDLKDESIPFCDGRPREEYPQNIQEIYEKIEKSDYAIFGMPVYCYSVSGPLKNFIDIFSRAFTGKYFGVCSAAGSKLSYLATADLMKMMSFESKSIGIQPTIMADNSDFKDGKIESLEIKERIAQMIEVLTVK